MTRRWTHHLRRAGLALSLPVLALAPACDRSSTDPNGDPHRELDRVEIIDRGQTAQPIVATWTADGGWDTNALPSIDLEHQERVSLGVNIYDSDGVQLTLQSGGEYSARYALASGAQQGVIDLDRPDDNIFHGDHVHIYGLDEGTTQVQFVLWHADHADGSTDPISIEVHGEHELDEALATVEIIDRGQTEQPVVATWTDHDGWDGELPILDLNEATRLSLGARIYDGHGEEYTLESDGEWSVRFWLAEGADAGVVDLDRDDIFHGDHVHVYGLAEGSAEIYFILWHDDHAEDQTTPIEVQVIE